MAVFGYIVIVLSFVFVAPVFTQLVGFACGGLILLFRGVLSRLVAAVPSMQRRATNLVEGFGAICMGVAMALCYFLWAVLAIKLFPVDAKVLLLLSVGHLLLFGIFADKPLNDRSLGSGVTGRGMPKLLTSVGIVTATGLFWWQFF